MINLLKEMCESFTGFTDEPIERECVYKLDKWPFLLWPATGQYRIVEHELESCHKYRIEAFSHGQWIEMQYYDDGCDRYGKLHGGKWQSAFTSARWSLDGVRILLNKLQGKENPVKVII